MSEPRTVKLDTVIKVAGFIMTLLVLAFGIVQGYFALEKRISMIEEKRKVEINDHEQLVLLQQTVDNLDKDVRELIREIRGSN